ncbi:UDP-glucuronosyltransferase 2A3 [Merluccius polli]|uniref:UDP-glucuronosyltransferase 2A3 n=1 Tax=Merluccius polli TaxID=89951 RepID=A0AA47M135_MERPO|nr:UDP-glucuronosyltransferase 2A3 [Merluccius polli]
MGTLKRRTVTQQPLDFNDVVEELSKGKGQKENHRIRGFYIKISFRGGNVEEGLQKLWAGKRAAERAADVGEMRRRRNSTTERHGSSSQRQLQTQHAETVPSAQRPANTHPAPPPHLDHAIFWTEYVMRHKGAAHLRTEAYRRPWYADYSIDGLINCWLQS